MAASVIVDFVIVEVLAKNTNSCIVDFVIVEVLGN